MLDTLLRRRLAGPLAPVAAWLAAHRVRALGLTLSAFLCSAVAMLDIGHHAYLLGLGLLAIGGMFDTLDGQVAGREGPTPFGATLDRVLSLTATAGVAFAFALAEPERALAAMFLMLGLVSRAAAEVNGGWIGKSELFVAFVAACIFPDWFSIIAYVTGILCFAAAGGSLAAMAAKQS